MKSMMLLAILLISASANAMMIEEFIDSSTGDVSALIKAPLHFGSDMPFKASSENGICKALGYEKAAAGSLRSSRVMANSIDVDSNGSVVGGPYYYVAAQIVCLNKTNIYPNEKTVRLVNPTHPDSGLGYSGNQAASSEDGICKAAGLTRAAAGSLRFSSSKVDSIRVDSNGCVVGGPYDNPVIQIVCVTNR